MNTNNVNNINTNKMINSDTINIILFVLFIVLIILIFNLNFSEPFDNLISDPQDIISFCNSNSPTTTFNAPSFVTLFNCNASNPYITNPTPYNIVLSPINVCPINSYLYSPTNTCYMIPMTSNLVAWYDPSDVNNFNFTINASNIVNSITIINKVTLNASNSSSYNTIFGNLTAASISSNITCALVTIINTHISNNSSNRSLLRINSPGTDYRLNPFLSTTINSPSTMPNNFTIFIVYDICYDPSVPAPRISLFNIASGSSNKIGMFGQSARFIGSNKTTATSNRIDLASNDTKIGSDQMDDTNNLSLYTACITSNNGNVTWKENIYNKSINNIMSTYNNSSSTFNIGSSMGNTLYICGAISSLNSGSANAALPLGFNGYLGEVLFYNTALDTTSESPTSQYNMIVNYLRNKWDI